MSDTLTGDDQTVSLSSILPEEVTCDTFDVGSLAKTPCITLFHVSHDDKIQTPDSSKSLMIPERTSNVPYNLDVLIPAAIALFLVTTRSSSRPRMTNLRIADVAPLIYAYYLGSHPTERDIKRLDTPEYLAHLDKYATQFYTELLLTTG